MCCGGACVVVCGEAWHTLSLSPSSSLSVSFSLLSFFFSLSLAPSLTSTFHEKREGSGITRDAFTQKVAATGAPALPPLTLAGEARGMRAVSEQHI